MIDERLRLSIHAKLTDLIGHDEADAIIAHIMPVPWHDVATHDDLHVVRNDIQLVRNDMSVMRAELRSEMADMRTELQGEIAGVRTELQGEIAGLRTDLKVEMGDMRVEMRDLMVGQTRWLLGYVTAFGTAMLAIARFVF